MKMKSNVAATKEGKRWVWVLFAALTTILAKKGLEGPLLTWLPLIRTGVVLIMS